ncbi:hypothetical protein LEP1GSC059_3120 [Leptospira noguchii serovar Panama str. CZ214]|uniref:Uncharacterized protein n=1 Tax=Leptospira noguchii serovar Panama str. CZ214 TaxID=1001595 RepID=T0FCW0_9LEPT|nr:hypothetical protein LEP1GSC059_3120 [Leptospira noguchii serovar Panama str. CZ214]
MMVVIMQKSNWKMTFLYFIVVPQFSKFNYKLTICESSHILFFYKKIDLGKNGLLTPNSSYLE